MEDKKIMIRWIPFKNLIECVGHQMPDCWWYVHTPFDGEWHFVPKEDVFEKIENSEEFHKAKRTIKK